MLWNSFLYIHRSICNLRYLSQNDGVVWFGSFIGKKVTVPWGLTTYQRCGEAFCLLLQARLRGRFSCTIGILLSECNGITCQRLAFFVVTSSDPSSSKEKGKIFTYRAPYFILYLTRLSQLQVIWVSLALAKICKTKKVAVDYFKVLYQQQSSFIIWNLHPVVYFEWASLRQSDIPHACGKGQNHPFQSKNLRENNLANIV